MKTKVAGRVLGPLGIRNRRLGQAPTHSQPSYRRREIEYLKSLATSLF